MFLLYKKDLVYVYHKLKFILCSDDTSALYTGKTISDVSSVSNTELTQRNTWFKVNKFLNVY